MFKNFATYGEVLAIVANCYESLRTVTNGYEFYYELYLQLLVSHSYANS